MERIAAVELSTHPGRVIDRILRNGPLLVTVRGYAACVLVDPAKVTVPVPEARDVTATALFRHTGEYVEAVRQGQALRITRHRHPVMLLLPVPRATALLGKDVS